MSTKQDLKRINKILTISSPLTREDTNRQMPNGLIVLGKKGSVVIPSQRQVVGVGRWYKDTITSPMSMADALKLIQQRYKTEMEEYFDLSGSDTNDKKTQSKSTEPGVDFYQFLIDNAYPVLHNLYCVWYKQANELWERGDTSFMDSIWLINNSGATLEGYPIHERRTKGLEYWRSRVKDLIQHTNLQDLNYYHNFTTAKTWFYQVYPVMNNKVKAELKR